MKLYYYLAFRIYDFLTRTLKRNDDHPLFTVSVSLTLLLGFNFLSIYYLMVIYGLVTKIEDLFLYAFCMGLVLTINHLLFVKPKRFLKYNFKRSWVGGLGVAAYVILTFSTFLVIANIHRDMVFAERKTFRVNETTE